MITIIDFGGQNNHLTARIVRDLHVFCEVTNDKKALEHIKQKQPQSSC